jgi:hypothetical protein
VVRSRGRAVVFMGEGLPAYKAKIESGRTALASVRPCRAGEETVLRHVYNSFRPWLAFAFRHDRVFGFQQARRNPKRFHFFSNP